MLRTMMEFHTGRSIVSPMYADDLVIISESREDLQNQIDKLGTFCSKWRLTINVKKSKVMVFNRGNKLLNANIKINGEELESVKTVNNLGFHIAAKNCSFLPTIANLATKANRAIFALNNKIKLSKLPARLALKIFQSQISPILLYGSEVWGPYICDDWESWEKSKIEQTHVQFLKRILGCNYKTSNIMTRWEVGRRPLMVEIIIEMLFYVKYIKARPNSRQTLASIAI